MPDSNKTQQNSQPLFEQKDILHDIETVQVKWAREQVRRRALMVKVFIVGGIFLLLAIGSVVHRIYRINQLRLSQEEQEQKKYLPIGYREAKIHIISYASDSSQAAEDILREAVDNKPSEFYIEFKNLEGVDGEEVEKALGNFRPGITINGKYKFKIMDENGVEKEVQLLDEPGYKFNVKELGIIINQIHQQLYGESYLQPITSLFGRRTQSIPIEGIDDDDDDLSEAKQAKENEQKHEEDKEETPEGVQERVPFSANDLLVPQLDVKDKK